MQYTPAMRGPIPGPLYPRYVIDLTPEFAGSFSIAGGNVHLELYAYGAASALIFVPRTAVGRLLDLAEQALAGAYRVAPRTPLDRLLRRPPRVRPLCDELSANLFVDFEPIPIGATMRFYADALPAVTAEIDLPQDALQEFIDAGRDFMRCVADAERRADSEQAQTKAAHGHLAKLGKFDKLNRSRSAHLN